MSRLITLLLALTMSQPTFAADLLREALEQLRGHVTFVDLSPEGRLRSFGEGMMTTATVGMSHAPDFVDASDDDDLKVAAILMLSSLAVWGLGGAIRVGSGMVQNARPAPQLDRGRTSHYMTAHGLNEFMRFDVETQHAFAATEPELSAFLIRLNDSYKLIKYYGLFKSGARRR